MIIDSRFDTFDLESVDVCIIGGGAAGITIALEMASRRAGRIIVLESGGWDYDRLTQGRLYGDVVGDRNLPFYRSCYSGLGGSTELWAGWCRPLDQLDFEYRDWVENSGWPFSRSELDPYYLRANEWCGMGRFGYDVTDWASRFIGPSLADGNELIEHVFQVKRIRFREVYRERLEATSKVSVILHATTLRLNAASEGNRVDSAQVLLGNGKQRNLFAKRFVLATGGLENPRLLLLSGGSPSRAIGNQWDLVGRYFTEHGFVDSGWFIASKQARDLKRYFAIPHPHDSNHASVRPVLTLCPATMADEKLLNAAFYFYPGYESGVAFGRSGVKSALELLNIWKRRALPGNWFNLISSSMAATPFVFWAVVRKAFVSNRPRRKWRLRCYYECAPNPSNRVRLGDRLDDLRRPIARLEWAIGEKDLASVRRFHEITDNNLRSRGLGMLSHLRALEEWRRKSETAKHPMGTTRMHESPRLGVVDRNCKVHGVSNLYISGSSVFPATGYANPTLTILALAVRLADHLGRDATP